MEQIFMLVFMVILIGIVIYFGIKENKDMYNGFLDNFPGTTKTDKPSSDNKGCSEGCTC